jgi:hypothetical protein
VTGLIKDAVSGRGGKTFPALPGMAPVTEEQLRSGTLRELFSVYGGIKSGRLVVLGQLGSGKSSAGIRLLLDALTHRAALTTKDRVQTPVPVLVTPQGWDPTSETFTDWLAERLARDYPLLRAPEYGDDVVVRLIERHLAVILDGLDEMPETLRSVALRKLDEQATFRLVVLARSEELVAAVSNDHLRGAAALELLPISPKQAAEYLTSQIDARSIRWQNLIDHLGKYPSRALAQALSTPLMLTLVRDIYRSEEVLHELIDVRNGRSNSREAIEDYLLDRVLIAAYVERRNPSSPPYTIVQARRWLGQLARRMKEDRTRNLAWWRIRHWVPAWPRAFITVIVIGIVSAFIVGPLAELAIHMHLLAKFRVESIIAVGAIFGKALGFAFMFGLGLLLMPPRDGVSLRRPDHREWSSTDFFMAVPLLLGVGAGVGLERGLVGGLWYRLVGVLMASFVVGVGFVVGGAHHQPLPLGDPRWSRKTTSTNLLLELVIAVSAGLVVGFGYGLVYGFQYGLAPGFIVGIGYICVIVLKRRSSLQRSHSLWTWTDIPTTLVIGLCIAIASSAGYGIVYVLIVILSGRSPLQRSRPRWSSVTTLTTILAGLVVGLVVGLVFALTHGLGFAFKGPGLVLGLLFGLTVGLLLGLRQPPTEATSPLDPQSLWRRERRFGLGLGVGLGPVVGLAGGLADWLVFGPEAGLVFGLTGGFVAGLGSGLVSSATWDAALAGVQLWRRGDAPAGLLQFLDDARRRQILRTVGPVYQFRDARLEDRLAEALETVPGKELTD